MSAISAVIITYNEAPNIGRCVESALKVAEEVLVIDSNSTDGTPAIAQGLGARVVQRAWDGYAAAKNFGNQLASHDTILSLDADEELSEELIDSILKAKDSGHNARFRRLTRYGNRWIRHGAWYPDIKTRLFNRHDFSWSGQVHEQLINPNHRMVKLIDGHLLHYSYKSADELRSRQKKYALLGARELKKKNAKAGWFHLYLKPAARFVRDYLLHAGFLDGTAGLQICVVTASAVHWKYAELRKLNRGE